MAARTKISLPSLRRHKASGCGYVVLSGHRVYLGRYGDEETQRRYETTLAEWLANGKQLPVDPEEITVSEVCVAYWRHAEGYYVRPNGTSTSSLECIRRVLRIVKESYGPEPATKFGPLALRAIQRKLIDRGLSRRTVNDYSAEIKRLFKWAASHEMVPASVYHGLQTVSGLRRGRSEARETEPVKPVPVSHVEAVKSKVSRQVAALIDLQLLTGARPGELVKLRAVDFDVSGAVWTVALSEHKTSYRGRERVLYFGPQAQAIIKRFMADRALAAYLFSPRDAEAKRYAAAETHRRPDQKPNARKTNRVIGEHYTVNSFRRAIERGCVLADVPRWAPNRLRHNAATFIRKEYGLEAAQILLGHAHADVTQIYAEADHEKAIKVVSEVG